jgi:hypothetical protein
MRRWLLIAVLLLFLVLVIVVTLLDAYSNAPLYRSNLQAMRSVSVR